MSLIRLKKATPGNIVLIDFSSKHEIGKSSEKRVNPLRQIVVANKEIRFLHAHGNNKRAGISKHFLLFFTLFTLMQGSKKKKR